MPKISSKNIDLKELSVKLDKNWSWVFLAGLILLLAMEWFQVRQSVGLLLGNNQAVGVVPAPHGERIDFSGYQKALDRIQQAPNFTPTSTITNNPFITPKP